MPSIDKAVVTTPATPIYHVRIPGLIHATISGSKLTNQITSLLRKEYRNASRLLLVYECEGKACPDCEEVE